MKCYERVFLTIEVDVNFVSLSSISLNWWLLVGRGVDRSGYWHVSEGHNRCVQHDQWAYKFIYVNINWMFPGENFKGVVLQYGGVPTSPKVPVISPFYTIQYTRMPIVQNVLQCPKL